MQERLFNSFESVVFALMVTAAFFVFALLAKLIFKKSIGTKKYYVTAIIFGFLLHRGLIITLINPGKSASSSSTKLENNDRTGLDSPFIAPNEDQLESFPKQLDSAIQQLHPIERGKVTIAIDFLSFALTKNIMEKEPEKFENFSDSDIVAKSLVKLYRYAQKNGREMSLKKYIELADEFKKQRPGWWEQYKVLSNKP